MIKKIRVKDAQGTLSEPVEVGQIDSEVAEKISINDSGNFEILSDGTNEKGKPQKVNISSAGDIQIKAGYKDTEHTKAGEIAFDNEFNEVDPFEVKVHICNGAKEGDDDKYANDTMALKLNVAEITIDSKKACTSVPSGKTEPKFDPTEMKVRVCNDKWQGGESEGDTGPIYVKWEARAHDIRCYDHGGIALQIAGKDGEGNENKIKFESDRRSLPNSTPIYCGEGGKGLEFGTFNTEKTSIFTPEYRFNKDGIVYASSRELVWYGSNNVILEQTEENVPLIKKIDYKTQADDFKDIKSSEVDSYATWSQIVKVASDYSLGKISAGSSEGEGGVSTSVLENYLDKTTYNSDKLGFALSENVYSKDDVYTKTEADGKYVALGVANFTSDSGKLTLSNEKKITIQSTSKGVEINAAGGENINLVGGVESNVNIKADKLKFAKEDESGTVLEGVLQAENGLSLDNTPYVKMLETKISSSGELSITSPVIKLAMQNNYASTVYIDPETKKVHIPKPAAETTNVYTRSGEEGSYEYTLITATTPDATEVFVEGETEGTYVGATAGAIYYMYFNGKLYSIEMKGKSGAIKSGGIKEVADPEGIVTELLGTWVAPESYIKLEPNEFIVTKTIDLSYVASLENKITSIEARLAALEAPAAGSDDPVE